MEDKRRGPDARFPPGFRFNPDDDELILYYLRRKIVNAPLLYDVFHDVNLYEHHPEKLVEMYKDWGEHKWYFFTSRDRKYPNGTRPNRKTTDGYWKATGVEKKILIDDKQIGVRKALVFYSGKAGKGTKTDWIMYEYINYDPSRLPRRPDGTMKLDDWVLCTIQKKRGADEGKSDPPEDKSDQPSTAEQATISQPTRKRNAEQATTSQRSRKQNIVRTEEEPQNYQIIPCYQKIQIHPEQPYWGGYQQIPNHLGRDVEPQVIPNMGCYQQIQHDCGELEPLNVDPLNYHNVGCYGGNAHDYNCNFTQAPLALPWNHASPLNNNCSITQAPAASPLNDDFMASMGSTDTGTSILNPSIEDNDHPSTEDNDLGKIMISGVIDRSRPWFLEPRYWRQ